MKKFLAMMLAVLMLLSMATVAMAEGGKTYTIADDQATFTFTKVVQNNYGTAPIDTYNFTIAPATDTTYTVAGPAFANPSFSITTAASGNKVVDLPAANRFPAPGKYLYKVTETAGALKGMTYDTTYYFVISVFYTTDETALIRKVTQMWKVADGEREKVDNFTNTYDAGDVSVKKLVVTDSEAAVSNYTYTFKFELTGLNKVTTGANGNTYYTVSSENGNMHDIEVKDDGTASFEVTGLKANDVVTIMNMPKGATYKVTEQEVTTAENGKETWTVDGEVKVAKAITKSTTTEETITNNFSHVGDLTIKKKVTGAGGDKTKVFEFTLTCPSVDLEKVNKTGNATITAVNGEENKYKITMKDGESVEIVGLPYNTQYKVTEDTYADYTTTTPENASGTITIPETSVEFINDKSLTPETGVSLDTLPYVLVLALAGAGLVLMIARKRRVQD